VSGFSRTCVFLALLTAACGSSTQPSSSPSAQKMLDVTLPDLSRMDVSVQQQVREKYQSMLATVGNPNATSEER
jgi:hypothetical protein